MKHIYKIAACLLFALSNLSAQQEFQMSNDRFTLLQFNPAHAGIYQQDAYASGYLSYRNQWLGFEGAPKTYSLITDYLIEDYNVGLGLSFFSDQIGLDSKLEVAGNYSYRIDLEEGYLNMGLRTAFSRFGSEFNRVRNVEAGDVYDQGNASVSLFSVGAGVMYHSENLRIGFSVPSIAVVSTTNNNRFKERHIYVHTAFKLGDPGDFLRIEPSLLFKYQRAVPVQAKLGAIAWINESMSPGIHYRWDDALVLSFGWLLDERLQLGVAYDFTISDIRLVSDNSFEIQLGYIFL